MSQSVEFLSFSEVKEQGFRNNAEEQFLTVLFEHSTAWAELGVTDDCCYISYWDSTLMIAFDVCDWNGNQVVRSVKVDFNGTSVLMGETGTNLFDFKFDPNSPNVKVLPKVDMTYIDLANEAAKWVFEELSRPIVLKEWVTCSYHHKQYELYDINRPLSWSDSQNKQRSPLGKPTRAAIVHPKNKRKML